MTSQIRVSPAHQRRMSSVRPARPASVLIASAVLGCGAAALHAQNMPPAAPVVTEPQATRIVNPSDVHMETGPFSDPNPGDTHRCTDWRILRRDTLEVVWVTDCIMGLERVHTHLGDGQFVGSFEGRRALDPESQYRLRVRHRDSSGDPATEWSPWSERDFVTGSLSTVFPLEIEDVLNVPAPTYSQPLPAGATPAVITISDASGQLLLELRGAPTGVPVITNPAPLSEHGPTRLTVQAGSAPVDLATSELAFTEDDGSRVTVYLPEIFLNPGERADFWVARNGATYFGLASQTDPTFASLARGAAVPWSAAGDVRVEIVATGFQLPVNIAFVPNPGKDPDSPYYYVTELYGSIKVVHRNGVVSDYASGLLNYNPTGNFPGSGEQGLAGVVVDPTNGDLYCTLLHSASSNPDDDNAPHHPRVVRFTSTDGGLTAATQTVILDMAPEQQGQSHQISNISFGPDDNLYIHVGDGFDSSAGRNLTQFRGKILRINRSGQPITSNPFYNAANGVTPTDYIFAAGVRNPFGGAWRASDNAHYFVENGPSVDRFARLVEGRDYLYDGSDQSMTNFALYNWNPAAAPVNITFIQPETFGGSGFPEEYYGRAYVTQSGGTFGIGPGSDRYKSVTEWVIDQKGNLVEGPRPIAIYNGGGASSSVAIAAGPDGLYFSDFYREDSTENPVARGSNILRISYKTPEPPPDCNGNGVPDDQDIADGTSLDCNANFIPDECDIAAGRSGDCNHNHIPDDCDTAAFLTENFNAGPGVWTLNGDAVLIDGHVRLTTADNDRNGTMIRPPLSAEPMTSFAATFDVRIGGGSGADGVVFAAFDASLYSVNSLFSEEGPGSHGNEPSGPGTLVVQFDTYDNGGKGENIIEVMNNGVTLGRYVPTFDLEDNQFHQVQISFRDDHLNVVITDASGLAQTAFEQLEVPYTPFVSLFGFGARTGGATNEQVVDNVTFRVPGPDDLDGDGVPDECVCPQDFDRSGEVNSQVFFSFIAAFFIADPAADFNFSGSVDSQDFFDFLAAFFTGC